MVCKGNICRSHLAEDILKIKTQQETLNWFVNSAATAAHHIGKPPHDLIETRYPLSRHLARFQLIADGLNMGSNENIPDLFHYEENKFHNVSQMPDECTNVMIKKYANRAA